MTVPNASGENLYNGTGSTAVYSFTFQINDVAELVVTETDTAGISRALTYGTEYTVTGVNVFTGGTVTRVAGVLPNGYKWSIASSLPLVQDTSIKNQTGFFPDVIERAFDRIVRMIQQVSNRVGRSLVGPSTDGPMGALPSAATRALKSLFFDALGNPTVAGSVTSLPDSVVTLVVDTIASIKSIPVPSYAVTYITRGYYAAGDGGGQSFAWDPSSALADNGGTVIALSGGGLGRFLALDSQIRSKRFGARANGVTDDTAALTAAVSAAVATGSGIILDAGTHLTTASIPNLHVVPNDGPGIISRGGNLWRVRPGSADINTIFVDPAGLPGNDGLSAAFPISFAAVCSGCLENLSARVSSGRWRVQFAAGTYHGGLSSQLLPRFLRYVEFRGANQAIGAWTASTAYVFGDLRTTNSGALLYRCVVPGTSGVSAPNTRAASIADGTAKWTYIGGWLPWVTGQAVTTGDYRKNAGKVYVSKTTATTGATPPTHSSGGASDGTVTWAYIGLEIPLPIIEGLTIFTGERNPPLWMTGNAVQVGDCRYNGLNAYRSETTGTTGASVPVHTSGTASDGTVTWRYIGARDTTVATRGFDFNPAPKINLYYLRCRNFQNTDIDSECAGIHLLESGEHLIQYYVAENCYMGSYHSHGPTVNLENTIFDSCDSGAFTIYHCDVTCGGPNPSAPVYFINCNNGLYQSRETVSHADYCVFDRTRNDAVFLSIMSRARSIQSHFLRNFAAVYCIGSSEWSDTLGSYCSFYLQTPSDGNTYVKRLESYSRGADGGSNTHQEGTQGELRYDLNFTSVSQTSTAPDVGVVTLIRALRALPDKWFLDGTKKLRVVVRGSYTGTVGTKVIGVYLGSSVVAGSGALAAATVGLWSLECEVVPTGLNTVTSNARFTINGVTATQSNNASLGITLIDSNGVDLAPLININRTLNGLGDSVTVFSAEAYITG